MKKEELVCIYNYITSIHTYVAGCSLVPRLSPCAHIYCVTFDPQEELGGGESGEFYHVSDVKGRETVFWVERTECGRAYSSILPYSRL